MGVLVGRDALLTQDWSHYGGVPALTVAATWVWHGGSCFGGASARLGEAGLQGNARVGQAMLAR